MYMYIYIYSCYGPIYKCFNTHYMLVNIGYERTKPTHKHTHTHTHKYARTCTCTCTCNFIYTLLDTYYDFICDFVFLQ